MRCYGNPLYITVFVSRIFLSEALQFALLAHSKVPAYQFCLCSSMNQVCHHLEWPFQESEKRLVKENNLLKLVPVQNPKH